MFTPKEARKCIRALSSIEWGSSPNDLVNGDGPELYCKNLQIRELF
jgi:hypothetical protein